MASYHWNSSSTKDMTHPEKNSGCYFLPLCWCIEHCMLVYCLWFDVYLSPLSLIFAMISLQPWLVIQEVKSFSDSYGCSFYCLLSYKVLLLIILLLNFHKIFTSFLVEKTLSQWLYDCECQCLRKGWGRGWGRSKWLNQHFLHQSEERLP